MNLEKIGFYTLSNERCKNSSETSDLMRCELVLSARCNFKCPYCRNVGGADIPLQDALDVLSWWISQGLRNVRFSGGEPLLYPHLEELVTFCKKHGVERIAISTNGSLPLEKYLKLIELGVNDFSVSLDACCAEDGDKMAGGAKGAWNKVVSNIKELSKHVYTTVGVVLTDDNYGSVNEIIKFADSLGVSDIRVIPAAQKAESLVGITVDPDLLDKYQILKYRVDRMKAGLPVRGLRPDVDSKSCGLVLDDMAVMGKKHYPCIIYMREGGKPIGEVGPDMRRQRAEWYKNHDCHADPICSKNCLDVCVDFNNYKAGL